MLDINQKSDYNKNLFQQSFELFPDLVFLISSDGKYMDYKGNNVTLHIPPKDFIGKKIEDIMPENIAQLQINAIRKTFENQHMQSFEFSLQLKGKTFYYENRLVYLNSDRLAMYVRDITENKTLEQKLKKSEERFKSIYFDSPIGIELYDSKGKLVDVNRACLDIFGALDVNSVKGFDLFQDPNVSEDVKMKLRGGQTVRFESVFDFDLVKNLSLYETKKSGQINIDVLITPLYIDVHETISNYLVQVQDITERKKVEEEIQKHNREYSALLEASKAVLRHKDFSSSSKAIFNACTELLGTPAGYIALLTPDKKENQIVFLNPGGFIYTVDSDLPMPIRGMRSEVIKSKEALYNNNFPETDWLQFLPNGHVDLESVMFIPLIIDDDVKGLMGMANKLGGFTEEDKNLASTFAEFVSIALQNSQSLESLEKSEQRYINLSNELEQIVIERTVELKESEEKWKALSENSPAHVMLLDGEHKILFINRTVPDLSKEEVIGISVYNFIPQEFHQIARDSHNSVWETSEPVTYSTNYKTKKGNIRIFNVWVGPVLQSGKIIGLVSHSMDVTDRKEAEQKLEESEEKFKLLYENAPLAYQSLDYKGSILEVNRAWLEFFGYTKDEVIGRNFGDFIDPGYLKVLETNFPKFKEKGEIQGIEYEMIKKDGSHAIVKFDGKISYDEDGYFKQTHCIFQDITEQKKAEKELKDSEAKYRSIIDNSGSNIFVYDKVGNYEIVNKQAAESFSMKSEDFIQRSLFDIFPYQREDVEEYIKINQNIIESGIGRQYERTFNIKNGPRTFLINDQAVKDSEGKGIYIVSSSIDITERKKAEEKIRGSEEKFRMLFNNANDAIIIVDLEGNIIECNKTSYERLGYTKEEFLNKTPMDLDTPKYAEGVRDRIELILHEGASSYEVEHLRKDGTIIPIEINSKLINFQGKTAILSIARDITERKKAEEELIKLNSLKSELLRRTSHELKTPLVSIKGFSDLLLEMHRDKLDDYLISILLEIKQGCERLETLISDILKTSELESDVIQLRKSEEDLSFLIRLCASELKGILKLRNDKLIFKIHEKLITYFEKEQIHQVISNILSNAIKYTPPAGVIEIKSEIENSFIVISIKDSGIGITEEEKGRLFKQFGKIERYGQGMDIIPEGSGLGLYISKKIIELHGGEIWVESEGRNKGSTFYFTLPLH